jgi:hypothetical protein
MAEHVVAASGESDLLVVVLEEREGAGTEVDGAGAGAASNPDSLRLVACGRRAHPSSRRAVPSWPTVVQRLDAITDRSSVKIR